jgi:uncharacterized protein involved in exopolysaccharide biosynthesis
MDTNEPPSAAPRAQRPRDIVLADYLRPLVRNWIFLAACALVGGLAALAMALTSPPVYEASAKLFVTRSKISTEAGEPQLINIATFRAILASESLVAQVLGDLKLDKPPYNMSVPGFVSNHLRVDTIRDSFVLIVTVRLGDPQRAAQTADRLASLGVELADRLSQEETVRGRDLIAVQLEDSRRALEQATARLENFRKEAQLDVLRSDTSELLTQRRLLATVQDQIASERGRVARAEQELAGQDRIRSTPTSIDTGVALRDSRDATQNGLRGTKDPALRPNVIDPYVNPVYEVLNQEIALARVRLSSLEHQRDDLLTRLRVGDARLSKFDQLYAREAELARLETEEELARKVYVDTAPRFEEARLRVAGRTPQLQVFDRAHPPDGPVSPRPFRSTLAGIGVGLIAGIALVVAREQFAAARG